MNNKITFGFEFTENSTDTNLPFPHINWPNGIPIDDDDFSICINNFLTKSSNLSFTDKETLISYLKRDRAEMNILKTHAVKLNLIEVKNVNDIYNEKYIFPFQIYSTTVWFQMDYFLTKGIYLSEFYRLHFYNHFLLFLINKYLLLKNNPFETKPL